MEILETKNGDHLILVINGRLDTTNYNELEKRLMTRFDEGHSKIIMDCSGMDYISSSGLRVFLMGLKRASILQGRFVLAGLQETIREIFEIAGFTTIFEIFGTREEAGKAIVGGQ